MSHVLDFHKVPFGYCWSQALVPKPPDWGDHIDVVGFFNLAEGKLTSYQPSPELAEFLADGASSAHHTPLQTTQHCAGASRRSLPSGTHGLSTQQLPLRHSVSVPDSPPLASFACKQSCGLGSSLFQRPLQCTSWMRTHIYRSPHMSGRTCISHTTLC